MARAKHTAKHDPSSSIELVLEEHDDFALSKKGQGKLDPRLKLVLVLAGVAVLVFFFGLIVPKNIFNDALHSSNYHDGYTLSWFVGDLMQNVNGLFALFVGDAQAGYRTANLMVKYGVIVLCGAGLALCGAVYQGTFRNALVSPSTLGVMSGAGLGMALWVVFFYKPEDSHGLWFESDTMQAAVDPLVQLWNSYGLALTTFAGCIVVVALVVFVIGTVGRGSTSGLMMIITGQVIGAVMGSVTSSIRYFYIAVDPESPQAQMMMELQISSFYRSYSLIDLLAVGIPVLVMFLAVMHYRSQLTLLAFSEDEARTMGVETRRMRFLIIGLATLVTAIIVSFCGRIGFVGFMMPHLARRLVGPNFTYLMPMSMVGGGIFVLASYVLVTMFLGDAFDTMSGMFISILGAVVFLISAMRGMGGKRGAF